MKNIKILAILALFLVAVRTDEEVLEEEVDPLVNMLQSMKSMSKFRRDVDSFFRPVSNNLFCIKPFVYYMRYRHSFTYKRSIIHFQR